MKNFIVLVPVTLLACQGESADHGNQPQQAAQASGQSGPPASSKGKFLMLKFPDGARGGRGKIQGQAKWQPTDDNSVQALADKVRECGGSDLRVYQPTHSVQIFLPSGPGDREIVRCLQDRLSVRFTAGIGSSDKSRPMDETPFIEFHEPRHSGVNENK